MGINNSINYSIIIPHKNITKLLDRCLKSIPIRDDIQIIIVDDNSDPEIVNFSEFPGLDSPNTEVYFTKDNKGAGFARNIGLTRAKGKWLIFADADDFFNECLNKKMDEYVDSSADLIFFKSNSVNSDSLEKIESRGNIYNIWLDESSKKKIITDEVKFKINPPWSKFYSNRLVKTYDIKFDEVLAGNDVMFSTKSSYFSQKIIIDLNYIYCSTKRENSLDNQKSIEFQKSRLDVALAHYTFLKKFNKEKYCMNFWVHINQLRKSKKIKEYMPAFIKAINTVRKKDLFITFLDYIHYSKI